MVSQSGGGAADKDEEETPIISPREVPQQYDAGGKMPGYNVYTSAANTKSGRLPTLIRRAGLPRFLAHLRYQCCHFHKDDISDSFALQLSVQPRNKRWHGICPRFLAHLTRNTIGITGASSESERAEEETFLG